jgi:CDP-glycerol glycerophosphotransferase (TagB/SpsB family)
LDINLFEDYSFNNEKFNDFLIRTNSVLIIKGHHVNNGLSSSSPLECERILNLKDAEVQEINPILKSADILLTDYCAAYFDFLLTEKPIIFTAFDLKEYISKSRELYFDYSETIAGPIAKNWVEVEQLLEKLLKYDEFSKIRKTKNAYFNAFRDKNNSERVYKAIIDNS